MEMSSTFNMCSAKCNNSKISVYTSGRRQAELSESIMRVTPYHFHRSDEKVSSMCMRPHVHGFELDMQNFKTENEYEHSPSVSFIRVFQHFVLLLAIVVKKWHWENIVLCSKTQEAHHG